MEKSIKIDHKIEISCWRNMVAHQYKLAWKEETFVNLVPINERHKIVFKNTFSWLVWLQECEENMGIQQMLSSWERKKLEWTLSLRHSGQIPQYNKNVQKWNKKKRSNVFSFTWGCPWEQMYSFGILFTRRQGSWQFWIALFTFYL